MDVDADLLPLPLEGMRVVEVSQVLTGAYAAMVLADLGADVVKVERPGSGDASRGYAPPYADGTSYYYWSVNRNKRSVVLDLRSEAGQRELARLTADADVLLHNVLPETSASLGLDYERLSATNPALVYCAITGFGGDAPDPQRSALDIVIQAASGIMSITGEPDGGPLRSPVPVADVGAALFAATAVTAAYHAARRTGRGRAIDVSMLQTAAAMLPYHWGEWVVDGRVPGRRGNEHPSMVPYGCYATRDGFVALAVNSDAHWGNLCDALHLPALRDDPRFLHNAERVRHRDEVAKVIGEALLALATDEIVARLERRRVPCAKVRDLAETQADPLVRFDQPAGPGGAGPPVVASPIRLSQTTASPNRAAPRLGEHTARYVRGDAGDLKET